MSGHKKRQQQKVHLIEHEITFAHSNKYDQKRTSFYTLMTNDFDLLILHLHICNSHSLCEYNGISIWFTLLPIMGMNVQMNKLWCANEEFEPCKCKRAPNDWIQAVNTLTLQMQNHCNKLITTKTPSMTKPQPIKHYPNDPNYKNSFNICFSQHFYCLWFINVSWHTLRTFSVLLSSFQAPHSVVCNQCDIIDFIYSRRQLCSFFVRLFFAPLGS